MWLSCILGELPVLGAVRYPVSCWCAEDPQELVSCVQGAAKTWQTGEAEDTAVAP